MLYIYILFLHTMYVVFLGARPTCLKQVLDKSMELRTAVTMRRDFVQLLPEGTKFFHPLCLGASGSLSWALNQPAHPGRDLRPRDARYPVLPFWLDGTEPLTLLSSMAGTNSHSHFAELGISVKDVEVCFCVFLFHQFHLVSSWRSGMATSRVTCQNECGVTG